MTEKNMTWDKQLISAFETEPFSLVISSNVLSIMKPVLMKNGFRDFPVLTLTGKPGSGKTTIARTCTGSDTKEYSFTDKVSTVKKELLNMPDGCVLLDDLAAFASQTTKQKAYAFLDEVVRLSYNGFMPVMIITVEQQALAQITPSCRERLLEVSVNDCFKEDKFVDILNYLMDHEDKLDKIILEFTEWYKNNNQRYDYKASLKNVRSNYQGKNPRSISMFFTYFISMCVFCAFAKEIYHVSISQEKIINIFTKLWKKRINSILCREDLMQKMFQTLISDNAFSPIKPVEKELCEALCSGICSFYSELQDGYCPQECPEEPAGYYYDPRDLFLDKLPASAILIEKPKFLYKYPMYCDTNSPLMIIRDDALLSLMNSELHKFCNNQGIHLLPFGPKELHQMLFKKNMCMYNYISNKHKTYTFKYDSYLETNISVIVIRLTKHQYKQLAENARAPYLQMFISEYDLRSFCLRLSEMFSSIHGMLGTIGN